jgi:hypothetical protein
MLIAMARESSAMHPEPRLAVISFHKSAAISRYCSA